jgi:glucuronoarabinoxylan endo-1,4-beta-xylanase
MNMKRLIFFPVIIFSFLFCVAQTDVAIDFNTEYQTIDGFGGYGGAREFFYGDMAEYPNWYTDEFVDFLVNDMGQTVIRVNMVGSFNYKEGTYDPDMRLPKHYNDGANAKYNNDYSNLKGDGSYLNSSIKFVHAMDSVLRINGDSLTLLLSLWSPPAWMKDNNDFMRGELMEKHYDDFADFIVEYIKTYEANSGLRLYNLSLQNEPNLGHPNWTLGCVYENDEYKNMMNVVHNRMIEEGVDHVKLIAPETVKFMYRMQNILGSYIGDVAASNQVDMFCSHSYGGDGISLGSGTALEWQEMYNYIRQIGNGSLWMTETGFNTDGWDGAMKDARRIYGALKYGQVSSWIWWTNGFFRGMEKGNEDDTQLSYYTSKNFFKYVRPGAKHVETTFSNDSLGIIAFKNTSKGKISVVMINNSSTEEDVIITNLSFPDEWNVYRSSLTEKCADLGTVNGKSFTLPAQSVTTVVSTGTRNAPSVDPVEDIMVVKDAGVQTIDLSGIGFGDGSGTIVVSAASSNHTLLNDPTVNYASPEATGTLEFTSKPGQTGFSTITVKVEDISGDYFGLRTVKFNLVVLDEVNQAPTIDSIEDMTVLIDDGLQSLELTGVTDGNSGNQTVTIVAESSNTDVVNASVVLGSLYYDPVDTGTATITITLTDNGGLDLGGVDTKVISFEIMVVEEMPPVIDVLKKNSVNAVKIYPNPVQDVLHVTGIPIGSIIKIYNLTGQQVYETFAQSNDQRIHLEYLEQGIYVLKIVHPEKGGFTTKLRMQ